MDVNSFLGGLAVKPVPVSTELLKVRDGERALDSVEPEPAGGEREKTGGDSTFSDLTKDITPSGIEVAYQSKPKRLYKVRDLWEPSTETITQDVADDDPDYPWRTVPSVTTVLDLLNKGGLTIWGMRVGIQGALTLFERGKLCTSFDWERECERVALVDGEYRGNDATVEAVEALLKEEKLTTNDAKDSAAGRGNIVHQALEDWAKTGKVPIPSDFDEREVGYVEGLVKFLEDADPTPVRTEVMVGSVEHGFAGRYDLELQLTETKKLRKTPKQKWHDVPAGIYLTDCKSSKGVYPSTHFRQLAAYEAARVECGYPATDGQYVLNVNGEGSYAFVRSTAVLDDFLAVLSVFQSDVNMKEAA